VSNTVEQIEIGGVPAFLANGTGPDRVGLVFGVGVADEPLPWRGITHLCEHLMLSEIDRHRHDYDGWVNATSTGFVCEGSTEDVVRFVGCVNRAIRALPGDRIEHERRILRAEAESRGGRTRFTSSLAERFGATSYGRLWYPEYGLPRLDLDQLVTWTHEHFHAGNCAAWVVGSDPAATAAALALDLHEVGTQRERRCREFGALPRTVAESDLVPSCSLTGLRSAAALVAMRILEQRLNDVLRYEHGVAYGVSMDYMPLDPERGHAYFFVDALWEGRAQAADLMTACLERFAEDGPTSEELERNRTRSIDALDDPNLAADDAQFCVFEYVLGQRDPLSINHRANYERLTRETVRAAFTEWLGSTILIVDESSEPNKIFPRAAPSSSDALGGTSYRTVHSAKVPMTVSVAEAGVSLLQGETVTSIPADSCAAVLAWGNGSRVLIGENGSSIRLEAPEWLKWERLVSQVDEVMPKRARIEFDPEPVEPVTPARGSRDTFQHVVNKKMIGVPLYLWAIIFVLLIIWIASDYATGGGSR
jgi:hypothetical protein